MNLLLVEHLIILFWLFVLGAVFGSLLNVCIYRLPLSDRFWPALKSLSYPPSSCPRCNQRIPFYDNVPILGWVFLRGRCRNCQGRISIRYPLIELLTAVLFVFVYWCEVPMGWWPGSDGSLFHPYGPAGISPEAMLHMRYALHLLLVCGLLAATFIDIDLRIIPDTVTLPMMAAGVLGNFLLGQVFVVPVWYQTPAMAATASTYSTALESLFPDRTLPVWLLNMFSFVGVPGWITAHPHLHGLAQGVLGILVGGGVVWGVRMVGYWALRREAMGFGDVVLLAMIGSFIGWQGALVVFFLAPACALVVVMIGWLAWREREIPYGPYLSVATLVLLATWKHVWPWFEQHVFALGPFLPVVALIGFTALGGMLVVTRTVQRLLGLAPDEPEDEGEWTSGDQLAYLAGQAADDRQGQWRRAEWPGRLSGRGQVQHHDWRHPRL